MKRIICAFIGVLLLISVSIFAADPPKTYGKAAIIVEKSTNTLIYEENADERLYPASMTKIMTGLLTCEYCKMSDTVTVAAEAVDAVTRLHEHAYLLPGEEISVESLLEFLLVPSGNDAATALAVHIAGSIDAFVEMMNQKAQELGCTNTHFANPNGLHDENHYSSARDMLKIAEKAMEYPDFARVVAMPQMTLPKTNRHKTETLLNSTNLLLSANKKGGYTYPGAIGIKTGFTTPAGNCLTAAFEKEGLTFYSVVMGCTATEDGKSGSFISTHNLFNYAKENYSVQLMLRETTPIVEVPVTVSPDGESVILLPGQNVSALLPNGFKSEDVVLSYDVPETLEAPLEKGQEVGTLTVSYNGKDYATIPLVSSSAFTRSALMSFVSALKSFFTSTLFKVIIISIIALVVIAVVFLYIVARRPSKRRRRGYRNYRR